MTWNMQPEPDERNDSSCINSMKVFDQTNNIKTISLLLMKLIKLGCDKKGRKATRFFIPHNHSGINQNNFPYILQYTRGDYYLIRSIEKDVVLKLGRNTTEREVNNFIRFLNTTTVLNIDEFISFLETEVIKQS